MGLALLGFAGGVSPADAQADGGTPRVLRAVVDGPITPVIDDYLADTIGRAENESYDALVIELDTPGGLDSSMRAIIKNVLDAEVPIVVYVSPSGARAGSAGALIALSGHVAAMAPGTAMGASTPVDLEGGEVSDKVVNDAAAYAQAIAELRDRNVEVAVDMVREGRSLSVTEALAEGVVDIEAPTVQSLLIEIDGRDLVVGTDARPVTLHTADATVDEHGMGLFRQIQQTLADPNLAFLFMSIGTLGLIYELATPGIGVGGVLGLSFILLGLFALSVLPVSAVGVVFLVLAAALFVAELFAPGIGIAAAGGSAALVLAGVFLFRDAPGLHVSAAVVAPVAVVIGGAVIVAGRLVVRSRREETRFSGRGVLIGQVATLSRSSTNTDVALINGAWWTVQSAGPPLAAGATVEVVGIDGLELIVEPIDAPASDDLNTDNNQGQHHHE